MSSAIESGPPPHSVDQLLELEDEQVRSFREHWEPGLSYHAVGAWLPLEEVDGENGCMCFEPGSHERGLLRHRPVDGDPRLHLLELDERADTSRAVEVPLRVGGATFHHSRTLHATAANRTARPRRAFANGFQSPPLRREVPASRPWLDAQRRTWAEHFRVEQARNGGDA